MFDAVLTGGKAPRRKLGPGVAITVAVHVLLVGVALHASTRPAKPAKKEHEVKFVSAAHLTTPPAPPPPPPPAPPAPPAAAGEPKVEKKPVPVNKPDTLVRSKDEPTGDESSKQPAPQEGSAGPPGGQESGVDGGVPGGTPGGTGTASAAPPPPAVLSYDSGSMTLPVLQSGSPQPTYPREALEAKVEGKVIARCTITEEGRLVDCRIIKSLPFLDEVVLANLAARRYSPVIYQGRPQRVYYTFPFTFRLP